MFSKILDKYQKQYNGMAFQTSPDLYARRGATKEALEVIHAWFDGHEKHYAVEDALKCLVLLYGDPVKVPCRTFWKVLKIEDEDCRTVVAHECVEQIYRYFRSRPGLVDLRYL